MTLSAPFHNTYNSITFRYTAILTFLCCVVECEPGLGAAVMYDLLYNPPTKLMLLGGCSTVSTTIGEAAKMWNLVVVSSSTSSTFYPLMYPLLMEPRSAKFHHIFLTYPQLYPQLVEPRHGKFHHIYFPASLLYLPLVIPHSGIFSNICDRISMLVSSASNPDQILCNIKHWATLLSLQLF